METLVETISLLPASGMLLGASLSLGCWLAVLLWIRRSVLREVQSSTEQAQQAVGQDRQERARSEMEDRNEPVVWEYWSELESFWFALPLRKILKGEHSGCFVPFCYLRERVHSDDLDRLERFRAEASDDMHSRV